MQGFVGDPIIDFTFLLHADLNPLRTNNQRLFHLEKGTNYLIYDALMLGPAGINTSSTGETRSITTPTLTYDQQSLGWAQSSAYQRLYVNGLERTNATYTNINQYASPNLVLNGVGKFFYEFVMYNYDMMSWDFERAA